MTGANFMVETWYIMTDGSFGDPREVRPDKDGVLTHKDGRKVAYAPHGPRTSGNVDPEAERAKYTAPKQEPFGGKGDHDGAATKAPALRRLSAWSRRATTSLPVPVSPMTSTLASLGAIWRMRAMETLRNCRFLNTTRAKKKT